MLVKADKYEIHLGDCLDVMDLIPSGSVDMVFCDLPYGVTAEKWDIKLDLNRLWSSYKRVLKPNGVVVLTATNPFASELVMSNLEWFKYEWIWDKEQGTNQFLKDVQPLRKHEQVLVFYKNRPVYNPIKIESWRREIKLRGTGKDKVTGVESKEKVAYDSGGLKYPTTVLPINRPHWREGRYHSSQKPILLMKYFIQTYTNDNAVILDNCMGSASTGVATLELGNRYFIGIEKNKEFFDIAKSRLEETLVKLGG